MGWSAFYASAKTMKEESAIELFKHCIDNGVTLFNSAVFYGPLTREGYGANLRLLNKCLKAEGVDRSKVQIMVKIGMDTRPPEGYEGPPGSTWNMIPPSGLQADVDWALEQLGQDYIDIIVLCRINPNCPVEESVLACQAIGKPLLTSPTHTTSVLPESLLLGDLMLESNSLSTLTHTLSLTPSLTYSLTLLHTHTHTLSHSTLTQWILVRQSTLVYQKHLQQRLNAPVLLHRSTASNRNGPCGLGTLRKKLYLPLANTTSRSCVTPRLDVGF